jgi:argininosuccinate lyase
VGGKADGSVSDGFGRALWSGRFSSHPTSEAWALGRSLELDLRLASADVKASIAHVRALQEAGLLSAGDADALEKVLADVGREIEEGHFEFDPSDEDIHSAVERGVIHRLGDLGARLHAGRSRNDLVATDLRLWLIDAGNRVTDLIAELLRSLVAVAREHAETVMPGATHDRPAQPITLGHLLLAHAWALLRDVQRFAQWSARASTSPLGAGALATSTLELDPDATAARLGFLRAFDNSLDAVSDRDFAQEFVAVCAIGITHVARIAADLVRLSGPALGWVRLDEAYTTGSSMMPNKQNPDVAELARAKAARITGDLVTAMTVAQGLSIGYHRDLQEGKPPAFDAADTLALVLPAVTGAVRTMTVNVEAMRAACDDLELFATDLAEALVRKGVAFRDAHRRIGEALMELDQTGRTLRDLTEDEWSQLGLPGGADLLDPDRSVRSRSMKGGPSPRSVRDQAARIEAALREL